MVDRVARWQGSPRVELEVGGVQTRKVGCDAVQANVGLCRAVCAWNSMAAAFRPATWGATPSRSTWVVARQSMCGTLWQRGCPAGPQRGGRCRPGQRGGGG
jgi:hypothetical protein